MDNDEIVTEADDTLDDDCTCADACDHEFHLSDNVWEPSCDPSCLVHREGHRDVVRHVSDHEPQSRADKFTWYPGDIRILKPGDPEYDSDDYMDV